VKGGRRCYFSLSLPQREEGEREKETPFEARRSIF
jgi:hypothetical protein